MLPAQLSVWHYLVRQAGDNKNNGVKSDMETTPYQRPHKGHFHTCEHDSASFSPVHTHIKKSHMLWDCLSWWHVISVKL